MTSCAHPRALATLTALEAEIAHLVAKIAPQLLTEPGFVPLGWPR